VFGFGGFSAEVLETKVLRMEKDTPAYSGSGSNRTRKTDDEGNPAFNWTVVAQVTYRLTIHCLGAVYTETAAASQTGPDVGEVTDFAIKTAESDALKRAATYLGTQFGLSLYDSGTNIDVVRIIFEPQQREALERHRAARAAAQGGQAQALVDRAMGQQREGTS
jgi:recombination DNA repair RAD52 pathway protein